MSEQLDRLKSSTAEVLDPDLAPDLATTRRLLREEYGIEASHAACWSRAPLIEGAFRDKSGKWRFPPAARRALAEALPKRPSAPTPPTAA